MFARSAPIIILAALLLLGGYMLGLKTYKNIWTVSAISIACILIAEPIIDYAVMRQRPARGALVGLIFGALGLMATLLL